MNFDTLTFSSGRRIKDRYEGGITSKEDLVNALYDACDLEHQLMCLYLYAAYSLKRDPDETCTAGEFEYVRRWTLNMLAVARQEMEHLHLANSMLTAIGAPPRFWHDAIPSAISALMTAESRALQMRPQGPDAMTVIPDPKDLSFHLRPFSRETIEMFICVESPPWDGFYNQADKPDFCFSCQRDAASPLTGEENLPVRALNYRPELAWIGATPGGALWAPDFPVHAGSVQGLYKSIRRAFETLDGLFPCGPSKQVDLINQYQISILAVKDRETACAAVDLIMRQGEGVEADSASQSHFTFFSDIRNEYIHLCKTAEDESRTFKPARDLLVDPTSKKIDIDLTRDAFNLADYCYATLLHILQALYTAYIPRADERSPYFASTLHELAYSPFMTMVIRVWSDVLALLPVRPNDTTTTGMSYDLSDEDKALLQEAERDFKQSRLAHITFYCERFEYIHKELGKLVTRAETETSLRDPARRGVLRNLQYMHQNMQRMTNNLVSVYQSGRYPKF
jgi:hypothetical protein